MATRDRQLSTTAKRAVADKDRPGLLATALGSYGLLWLGTLRAALVAIPFAGQLRGFFEYDSLGLAPAGSTSIAALILANNVREAMVPFLFAVLRVNRRRRQAIVMLGDVVVGASLAANVALAGLAVGSYGLTLFHYLPQWPLEWGGLALALTAWRRARTGRRDPCELVLLAIGTVILLCLAALLETYAVPQS
jgi:hypothetical protein